MLLRPLGVRPPNNTALSLVTDVRVKLLQGGGLSPVTAGEIHWPEKDNIGQTVLLQSLYNVDTTFLMFMSCV